VPPFPTCLGEFSLFTQKLAQLPVYSLLFIFFWDEDERVSGKLIKINGMFHHLPRFLGFTSKQTLTVTLPTFLVGIDTVYTALPHALLKK